jgi:hypothetical protein
MDAPKGNTLSFQWTARGIAPYLNRLHRRAGDFEQMAVDVLGSPHRFGFRAGLTSVGYTEKYETAAKRVCVMLGKAQETLDVSVYWASQETRSLTDEKDKLVVQEAITAFGDPTKVDREVRST